MKIYKKKKSRNFLVGRKNNITIKHCANIDLNSDEQITFVSKRKEFDFVKKNWGYYVTPSINGRLINFNYDTALVKNRNGLYYVLVVEKNKKKSFKRYISSEKNYLVCWLNSKTLNKISNLF
jgi:hypothetical protein